MIDPEELLEDIADMEEKGYEMRTILESIKARLTVETIFDKD